MLLRTNSSNALQNVVSIGSTVFLLHWEKLAAEEFNLIKIVKFLGGTVRAVQLSREMVETPDQHSTQIPKGACVIASARSLSRLFSGRESALPPRKWLARVASNVLVYGFDQTESENQLLGNLSGGALVGVEAVKAGVHKINVTSKNRKVCRQLSGVEFETKESEAQIAFSERAGQGECVPLASIGPKPFFAAAEEGDCKLMLMASSQIADLDAVVPRGVSILRFFSTLAPVLMFLRNSSENGFWHNASPSACFIIDDPLLKRRYGFLDYQKLLLIMENKKFCTSIAFIPWNYNRSKKELAELFSAHPDRYSLCVHGCDHTRGEFGATDETELREKAGQALERMTAHRKLSGVGFDDVMVFPQGIFSSAAIQALKSRGYLAAVNTSAYPVDQDDGIGLGQLLQVAVTRFADFPLFTRRYPQNFAELAFDLFIGKPALVVEHHGFFRNGYEALAEAVEKLNRLDERLQWSNLGAICSRACLKKTADNGDIHVLFFTDRFSLKNENSEARDYVLNRRMPSDEEPMAFTRNGEEMEITREGEFLRMRFSMKPGESVEIKSANESGNEMNSARSQKPLYQAKVFIRRCLSEFRDNYVDTSPILNRSARNR